MILLVAVVIVVGSIVALRLHAFIALLCGALAVTLLAPGVAAERMARLTTGFGQTAGNIGIVIALASIIGTAMMESGAADRIVRAFLGVLGEKHGAAALASTGFVLSIPVFFDTVFYLLVPLARSMHRRTRTQYVKYITAIAAGAAATHTLVPPTPGPLAVSNLLGVDLGLMVMMGFLVALPAATAGFVYAGWIDRRMPIQPEPMSGGEGAETEGGNARAEPGLLSSCLPIVLPVVLISSHTLTTSMTASGRPHAPMWDVLTTYTVVLGNANVALLLAAALAMWTLVRSRGVTRDQLADLSERSLASAGPIILITAAGGAFGATLQGAEVGPAIQSLFAGTGAMTGVPVLFLAFGVASLLKMAQGSSTVAMITTAGMITAMLQDAPALPFHAVYLATAIAGGSLVGTWMNDSGFWVFSRMGGLSASQTLRSWTPVAAVVGTTAFLVTLALAMALPLR